MPRNTEALNLVAAVIGAALLANTTPSIGFGAGAVGDIAILMALFAFDTAATRSGAQSLAFGAAAGFCLITPFQLLANSLSPEGAANRPIWLVAAVWVAGTLLMFALDRFRMASREPIGLAGSGLLDSSAVLKPIEMRPRPVPVRVPTPVEIAPVNAPVVMADHAPSVAADPEVAKPGPVPVPPPVDVTAIPPGREAVIYLNLVGEGLNVLRTVRAENLGHDYYRIADVMPEGEQWEFGPGQVVRCRKKSLSNGKHMVAYEEAPRA